MSSNKNALIRYKILDKCLSNRFKKYTLDDLIDECSEALFDFENKEAYISKRTIQADLQNMRSEKFGYEAPIEVYEKKYYRYSDPEYSIHNISVNENDLKTMNNAIQILKQFKDFSMFSEMNGVLQKLENSIHSVQEKSIIHLDKNEGLKGLEYIDILYQSILNKNVLNISYKSFSAKDFTSFKVHPQFLKEYNNRWFLFCVKEEKIINLALDRIQEIEILEHEVYKDKKIDPDLYFREVIGVTVSERQRGRNIIFLIDKSNAPYVKTKPFHHSQVIVEEKEEGTVFKICVQINYELERLLLGFGDSLKIIQPERLKQGMVEKLKKALKNYKLDV